MVSIEAFINELAVIAAIHVAKDGAPGWLTTLGEVLNEAEEARGSLQSKYQLAMFVVSGKPFERGKAPFQDFDTLLRLRNDIVHLRPYQRVRKNPDGNFVQADPKVVKLLQGTGALGTHELLEEARRKGGLIESDWLDEVSTKAMARWACNAAAAVVSELIAAFPPDFADQALDVEKQTFKPIAD
ncbi:MAG: hypothetical protein ACRD2M_06420 [Terriglobales bacterium]